MPLSITYDELRRNLSRAAGYTHSPSTLSSSSNEYQTLEDAIRTGLRDFYQPRYVAEGQPLHIWSFLKKHTDIPLVAGSRHAPLPEDFAQLTGGLRYSAGTGLSPIALVKDEDIYSLISKEDQIGPPRYAAVTTVDQDGQTKYQLIVYPKPAEDYTLSVEYRFEPETISAAAPYPRGAALHSETILAACLVALDKIINPESGESKYSARYQSLMMSSLGLDMNIQAPEESSPWPIEFPDSNALSLNKNQLLAVIGQAMGIGANPDTWTHGELSKATESLRSGLRRFYDPPVIPGERNKHLWSFLEPVRVINLEAEKHTYDLPEDFAMLSGNLTYAPGTTVLYPEIKEIAESDIRYRLQHTVATGRPSVCATRVKDSAEDGKVLYEILFYPIPDQDYEVSIKYRFNPLNMASDVALPMGGQPHAQTIIEACLAAVEDYGGAPGVHSKRFMESLYSSISHDRQVRSPDYLGYNHDSSDRASYWNPAYPRHGSYHSHDENIVTLRGYTP